MKKPRFSNINTPNLSSLKWSVLVFVVLISGTTLLFTETVVERLKRREQRIVELYAKTIEYAANESNNENLTFVMQEIIVPNNSIPVILANRLHEPIDYRNLDYNPALPDSVVKRKLKKEIEYMGKMYNPIEVPFKTADGDIYDFNYVYYKNSFLLTQLRWYPYLLLCILFALGALIYYIFRQSKVVEQNRIWVGLAKETAHQLGTPLSSMMAWLQYLQSGQNQLDDTVVGELQKDVDRLNTVTSRFSNIGSVPALKTENLHQILSENLDYLRKRISQRVGITFNATNHQLTAAINRSLFDWVIENLCKNAVDAMNGSGTIQVTLEAENHHYVVDVTDSGKGIPKGNFKRIFHPGFTSKKRGWGLGLTLAKRIIEDYHKGKLFVLRSEPFSATTFRILLPKENLLD